MVVRLEESIQEGSEECTHLPVTSDILKKLVELNMGVYYTTKYQVPLNIRILNI